MIHFLDGDDDKVALTSLCALLCFLTLLATKDTGRHLARWLNTPYYQQQHQPKATTGASLAFGAAGVEEDEINEGEEEEMRLNTESMVTALLGDDLADVMGGGLSLNSHGYEPNFEYDPSYSDHDYSYAGQGAAEEDNPVIMMHHSHNGSYLNFGSNDGQRVPQFSFQEADAGIGSSSSPFAPFDAPLLATSPAPFSHLDFPTGDVAPDGFPLSPSSSFSHVKFADLPSPSSSSSSSPFQPSPASFKEAFEMLVSMFGDYERCFPHHNHKRI